MRGKVKWTEESNNKDTGEGGDVRGKGFLAKSFIIRKQSVSLCNWVDLVNSVDI